MTVPDRRPRITLSTLQFIWSTIILMKIKIENVDIAFSFAKLIPLKEIFIFNFLKQYIILTIKDRIDKIVDVKTNAVE